MLNGGFDAALLDILLPGGMDGLAVIEHVRAKRCKTAIMVLTAVDTVPHILRAFDIGADDYLVKPFMQRDSAGSLRGHMQARTIR
jgi:two-component system OmpR family response regulator